MTTITISGLPGTGTTTIAQLLEKQLKLPYIYAGALFRKLAEEHKMSLEAFGTYCETHPEIDRELDRRQLDLLTQGEAIIEGRMTGWLAAHHQIDAHKILLTCDIDERVQRLIEREQGDFEIKKQEMLKREQSEQLRYNTYYQADPQDESLYDLVIDTTNKTPKEILDLIIQTL